ncbi:MAG: phosphate-starvation-inducible protein PsiE [Azoarcus sp.]|jgi:protein PsiE|nr:phosphate-starvation-inducible protein PsiE [Azoarcus sp.]
MLTKAAIGASAKKRKIGPKALARHMKRIVSFMLLALAGILLAFLVRETWVLIEILLSRQAGHDSYEMIEAVIIWFLYFEFIALIGKYFESRFHFPLRYFIYIGITAVIRLIIVDHSNPVATLVYSLALLVLLVSLYIANTHLLKRI